MLCPLSSCVFPITVPPLRDLEGPHGDRVAGDNTQHSHRLLSFSFYVTRLRTKRIQTRPLTCTVRQARRSLSRRRCGSCSVFEIAHTVYKYTFNKCFGLPLQEFCVVYPKLDEPPLSLSGFSPTTQIGAILYKIIRRSRGRQSALA